MDNFNLAIYQKLSVNFTDYNTYQNSIMDFKFKLKDVKINNNNTISLNLDITLYENNAELDILGDYVGNAEVTTEISCVMFMLVNDFLNTIYNSTDLSEIESLSILVDNMNITQFNNIDCDTSIDESILKKAYLFRLNNCFDKEFLAGIELETFSESRTVNIIE